MRLRHLVALTLLCVVATAATALSPGVYVYDRATSTMRRLSGGCNPSWSPDGARVVFNSKEAPEGSPFGYAGQIYTVAADGSKKQKLGGDALKWAYHHPQYSSDGRFISALAYRRDLDKPDDMGGAFTPLQLSVFGLDGQRVWGPLHVSWSVSDYLLDWRHAAWKPGGEPILATSDGESAPFVVNVVTGERRTLTGLPETEGGWGADLCWSLDGQKLAVQDDTTTFIVDMTSPQGPIAVEGSLLCASPTGGGFTLRRGDDYETVDANGLVLPTKPKLPAGVIDYWALSAADGLFAWFSIVSGRDGFSSEVGFTPVGGPVQSMVRLDDAQAPFSLLPPQISPDGQLIVFSVRERVEG